MNSIELSDPVIAALARLVDDAQCEQKRQPTHSTLTFHINRANLGSADPAQAGQNVGKAKRVRAVLSWALENSPRSGAKFAATLVGVVRGYGGFRPESPNFVGDDVLPDVIETLAAEGYVLERDGSLRTLLLDALSGREMTNALAAYVRRAKRGVADAALVTGTGKDLLEATAKHVLIAKFGTEPTISNFPTLVANAFIAVGLCVDPRHAGTPQQRVEAALYELACAVNALRNAEGVGHGRAFPPTVTDQEARSAIESMGVIAERLLAGLK